jgi:glycosyltransferase involved in cell wall biosynthesis
MKRACIVRHRDYEMKVRREAHALRDDGFRVDVICLRETGHRLIERQDGVRVIRLPLGRERGGRWRYLFDYAAFFVAAALVLSALELKHHYDAVQINTMPDALAFAALVPKLRGSKIVVFMHEPSPELARITIGSERIVRILTKIEQAVLRWADVALTVTEQLKQRYVDRGADPSKIRIVLNGPDPELLRVKHRSVRDAHHFTVVCHGTIEERYGHEDLLEAVRLARFDVPNVRLVVTGTGSDATRIEGLARDMDLDDVASFLGVIEYDEVVSLLARADLGVVPMRSNAYSNLVHTNKMFEFMSLGIPVLATRLDAVAATFDDSTIAFAEPDDPKSLAMQIIELAQYPERRIALVRRATEVYAGCGWPAQKELYLEAFR